jgi:hypothetical protein
MLININNIYLFIYFLFLIYTYFVPTISLRYGILYRLQEVHFDLDLKYKAHVNIIYINMHEIVLVFQILTTLHSLGDHH